MICMECFVSTMMFSSSGIIPPPHHTPPPLRHIPPQPRLQPLPPHPLGSLDHLPSCLGGHRTTWAIWPWVSSAILPASVVPIPPPFTCSPNTSVEQTPERTVTERSCMREVLRSSDLNGWRLCGKRSWENGRRDPRPNCPSGAVSAQARRKVIQRPLRVRRKRLKPRQRRNMTKRRRSTMRRRNNSRRTETSLLIQNIPYISLLPCRVF